MQRRGSSGQKVPPAPPPSQPTTLREKFRYFGRLLGYTPKSKPKYAPAAQTRKIPADSGEPTLSQKFGYTAEALGGYAVEGLKAGGRAAGAGVGWAASKAGDVASDVVYDLKHPHLRRPPSTLSKILGGLLMTSALGGYAGYRFSTEDPNTFTSILGHPGRSRIEQIEDRFASMPDDYNGPPVDTKPLYDSMPVNTYRDKIYKAMIELESDGEHFDAKGRVKKSSADCRGIAMLAKGTAKPRAIKMGLEPGKWLEPETNLKIGRGEFEALYERFQNVDMAILGYNGGPGSVIWHISGKTNGVGDPRKPDGPSMEYFVKTWVNPAYYNEVMFRYQRQEWERGHPNATAFARHYGLAKSGEKNDYSLATYINRLNDYAAKIAAKQAKIAAKQQRKNRGPIVASRDP
jgi:hypothetical protein